MLRQLARLTRPFPAAGPLALALAVYDDEDGGAVPARESGFEGVACVDDAARALVLLCDLWKRTGLDALREWAFGLRDFVLLQQRADGDFANFAYGWDGAPNLSGPTSAPRADFWHARALRGLARVWRIFDDPRAGEGAARSLGRIPAEASPALRARHVLALLDLWDSPLADAHRGRVAGWCEAIAALHAGGMLLDDPLQREPHLWGHIQEGALARASVVLGRTDLLERAAASADAFLVPIVESGFDLPTVQPHGVASAVYVMDELASASGAPRYARLAALARSWFAGRNPARAPVYDRERGRVADGIDDGTVSRSSGAEANILGAQALLDDAAALLRRDPAACLPAALSARSAV